MRCSGDSSPRVYLVPGRQYGESIQCGKITIQLMATARREAFSRTLTADKLRIHFPGLPDPLSRLGKSDYMPKMRRQLSEEK